MDFILPHLALGDFVDAIDNDASCGITRILTLCEQLPTLTTAIVVYRPIPDETWLPARTWQRLVEELSALLVSEQNVLVHCRLGISRSPSLVAAYLAYAGYATHLNDALQQVKQKRPCVNPHSETWRGVIGWNSIR